MPGIMAVVDQREGHVGDETPSRAGVRCCPKTARSFSLRQRKRMHVASLPSAAALCWRPLHQRVCPEKTWAPEKDPSLLWACWRRTRLTTRRRCRLLHHQLRAKPPPQMRQQPQQPQPRKQSPQTIRRSELVFFFVYSFLFGVGSTKMNQITTCTLKYRDTCSGHSQGCERGQRQRYSQNSVNN